ncbi:MULTISPECIES: exodeoxyribonuclease III [Paeniglutamicibacter]|uniref:Exodeoxyribonuclease III n=1 Tax=Paeniglutamicibacter terrestris TaxID=2723403 RepID=A0ABX1G551_9MICC|nr:exodeoxyribonuclease III [Paeniglutamicibacter sp. Y32M11]NKG21382.1 exodeoxyribonuclease III [Paeniglutamicibacter terrestris]QXQ11031.1 exodeoxyribonuclease III [Paeniglutamicibacter sp. Y32M11]
MIPTSEEILAKSDGSLRIASVNVNGVRAAYKRGMADWIAARDVDVLCLQEVRAPDAILRELIGDGWHILHAEASDKGRAGVAVLSRVEPVATRSHIGDEYFETTGRWVEADFALADGKILTVVSAYVHSGEVDTPKQVDKFRFLDRMIEHLPALKSEKDYVLVVGDLNVGHKTLDIKNWKGNVKRSGFLPEERAYFDRFFGDEIGYKDVARELAGEVDGPFTWWSWRGQAFVNDTGWRIDYHMATPELAALATKSVVDRASSYDVRFSDHAPLVVDYQF